MAYNYDYFVAELTCPNCGNISPADTGTNAQTYIRDNSEGIPLVVGSTLVVDPRRIRTDDYDGYFAVNVPDPGEPIHILHTWDCHFCDKPVQWMQVIVAENVIESITAITFDRAHVERCHLVSWEVIDRVADLTGLSFEELRNRNLVQLLLEHLPHDTPGDTRG